MSPLSSQNDPIQPVRACTLHWGLNPYTQSSVCPRVPGRGLWWKLRGKGYSFSMVWLISLFRIVVQPHRRQHTRFPCPSASPGVCSNSCPSSQWCHPTLSSSVVPFSSCLQSFPTSGSFLIVSSLHHMPEVLVLQLQHQSFQWIFRTAFL